MALEKLKTLFGIEVLMLGGGGVLNWSFIQAGMCDEISVVIASCADGSTEAPALFAAKEGLSTDRAVSFAAQRRGERWRQRLAAVSGITDCGKRPVAACCNGPSV